MLNCPESRGFGFLVLIIILPAVEIEDQQYFMMNLIALLI